MMGIHLVVYDADGKPYEFDLITSFDEVHWWAYCLEKKCFTTITLERVLSHE